MTHAAEKRLPYLRLLLLTAAALAIHGYHLCAEDGEIYVPAARKLLHPGLYPFGTEFFTSHGKLSMFSPILAWTAKLTHLSMDWTLFAWYLVSLFATLASCWLLVRACFATERARWSAVAVAAAVLTMPATNTGLLLIDPYLTARSFSTPLTLFALASCLERRYIRLIAIVLLTAAIHPQMAIYLIFLAALMRLAEVRKRSTHEKAPALAAAGMLPTGFQIERASGPYREALYSRDYFFLYNWEWYHWLGMLAPLAILAWFWRGNVRGTLPGFRRLSFAMIPFGLVSIAAAAVVSLPMLEMFVRLQPLRSFHLITFVFVLLFAGVVGEYIGKDRPWAIAVLCCVLAAGMFFVARQTYPNSPQIELPSKTSTNPWVNTLLWVRRHTPENAVFAVDSRYFKDPEVDVHGFRAIAERSELADYYKDGGVVTLFPALAGEWKQMSNATYGLNHFQAKDFDRLRSQYPAVSWTIVHGPAPEGMDCPYQNQGFAVCRLNATPPDAASN
ncbi:MAG: hypothetical protein KGM96_08335 [Acidobacteriota bacterium]|nr:hypothetical protein [Acidobacteriota bacterium]